MMIERIQHIPKSDRGPARHYRNVARATAVESDAAVTFDNPEDHDKERRNDSRGEEERAAKKQHGPADSESAPSEGETTHVDLTV